MDDIFYLVYIWVLKLRNQNSLQKSNKLYNSGINTFCSIPIEEYMKFYNLGCKKNKNVLNRIKTDLNKIISIDIKYKNGNERLITTIGKNDNYIYVNFNERIVKYLI